MFIFKKFIGEKLSSQKASINNKNLYIIDEVIKQKFDCMLKWLKCWFIQLIQRNVSTTCNLLRFGSDKQQTFLCRGEDYNS